MRGFNPTLVRLRIDVAAFSAKVNGGFNPTLVRLRVDIIPEKRVMSYRFNPTLVRLRRTGGGVWEAKAKVSIPRWFD